MGGLIRPQLMRISLGGSTGDCVDAKTTGTEDPDWGAARIAVLVARSAVTERGLVPPAAYRLAHASELVSADHVAHYLAKLPKPLKVTSKLEGICVVVMAGALQDDAWAAARHEGRKRTRGDEHPLDFVAERFGGDPDSLMTACHGAGELIQVTGRALSAWERDYYHENGPTGGGGALADSRHPKVRGIPLAASDSPSIIDFGWAVDDKPPGFWLRL
jgi:hypothetical protein